jgi:hypothetical protein
MNGWEWQNLSRPKVIIEKNPLFSSRYKTGHKHDFDNIVEEGRSVMRYSMGRRLTFIP